MSNQRYTPEFKDEAARQGAQLRGIRIGNSIAVPDLDSTIMSREAAH